MGFTKCPKGVLRDLTSDCWSNLSTAPLHVQAAGFYEKQGYAEIGRLKDLPPGHDRIWMAKRWG
jgi:hypothetical protein